MKMKKIALVIPYNPIEETGGLEIGTLNLAKELKSLGVNPIIITKGKSGIKSGIEIIGLPNLICICQYLIEKVDEIDVVHWLEIFPESGEIYIQTLISGFLRTLGKKLILMVATSGNLRNRGGNNLSRDLIRNNFDAYVISNSDQFVEFKEDNINPEITYSIGFGVSVDKIFKPVDNSEKITLRQELNLPLDKKICLFIGRFVERKRPDFLLKAWASLSDIYSQAELIVVGSGMEQHDSIEETVLNLATQSKSVQFRSITDHPEKYYQASDILLLPSDREGQPNVLLESMACGNSIVASDIPGINELLQNNVNGLTFPVNEINVFQSAIRQLVYNDELRQHYGQVARKTILDQKTWSIVVDQYLNLYNKSKGE